VTRTSRPDGTVRTISAIRGVLAGSPAGLGQGVVEYGLILSLSAALAVILLVFFGGTVSAVLNAVGDAIDAAS
jgi:Flp pilus assembly pilin Flp